MKFNLKLHPYHPVSIQELPENDLHQRWDACARVIQTLVTAPKCGKVIFSDEFAIYRSCSSRNVVFWSKVNPGFYHKLKHILHMP
jgi:hypothetical protein